MFQYPQRLWYNFSTGLYFEGKFDTEALLTMMTKKVLEPIGYDYSQITIQYADRVPVMSEAMEEESSMGMVQGM